MLTRDNRCLKWRMVKMSNKKKILWITQTAVFIALLIVLQAVTASLGNTMITGTVVNLLLIVSVMTCGLASGISVAAVSPVIAKLIGIGPFWILIPFIAAGNIVLVLIWHFIGKKDTTRRYGPYFAAMTTAAVVKFLVIYIGVVKIAVPLLLKLPEPQASVVSGAFSVPQLFTALAGGIIASIVLPNIKKAL